MLDYGKRVQIKKHVLNRILEKKGEEQCQKFMMC